MDAVIIAVVSSALGSAGLFSLVQFLISRHDSKDRAIAEIKTQLNRIENKSDRNELAITRLQLIYLIHNSLHFLISYPCIIPPPFPLPTGNHWFVLCNCESVSF